LRIPSRIRRPDTKGSGPAFDPGWIKSFSIRQFAPTAGARTIEPSIQRRQDFSGGRDCGCVLLLDRACHGIQIAQWDFETTGQDQSRPIQERNIAFGSIRMEPVFMILAQSAATGACLALDRASSPHEIPYQILRDRLAADGQILSWPSTPPSKSPTPQAPNTPPSR
jgi:hypothetical protein